MEYIAEEFYYLSLILNKVFLKTSLYQRVWNIRKYKHSKIYWISMIEELNQIKK